LLWIALAIAVIGAGFLMRGMGGRTAAPSAERSPAVNTATPAQATAAVPVSVATVATRDVRAVVRAPGSIQAPQTVKVTSKIPGRVTSVLVREGDRVRPGQAVILLDASDAQAQLAQARAGLAAAMARVPQAQTTAEWTNVTTEEQIRQARAAAQAAAAQSQATESQLQAARASVEAARANVTAAQAGSVRAQSDLARAQSLAAQGALPAQQVDAARAAADAAAAQLVAAQQQVQAAQQQAQAVEQQVQAVRQQAAGARAAVANLEANRRLVAVRQQDVEAARAAVAQARAFVRAAEINVANTVIRVSVPGTVTARDIEPGEIIGAGVPPSGVPLLTVAQIDAVEMTMNVSEVEIAAVRPGQPATVDVDALPGRSFTGTVQELGQVATPRARTFEVKVQLPNPTGTLRPGMFGRGVITTRRLQGVTVVPQDALSFEQGRPYVFVVEGDKAKRQPVRTGVTDGGFVHVMGLPAGARVIVQGQNLVQDGSTVAVQP
jgi:RND family efflux transporter MFP subunit